MVAPRAHVFRPLVKGNEALGTRLVQSNRAEKRLRMRETWAPKIAKSALSLVRVDFLFCSFDVLFVWFVPRNGP